MPRAKIEPAVADGGPAILLRTDRDVGLAAFRSGDELVVVLDTAVDFALAAGLDPVFAGLSSRYGTKSTVLRLPLAAPRSLRVALSPAGWLLAATLNPVTLNSIQPQLVPASIGGLMLRMAASQPAGVVSVLDPAGGGVLLVGTQTAPGEAVSTGRHEVQFDLPTTLQGVVVAPASDDIQLRHVANGFEIAAGPHANRTILTSGMAQPVEQPGPAPASLLFQIPRDTSANLAQTLELQQHDAAEAPVLAKSQPRLRMAETMLALGMDVEALSVLDLALAEDPALSDAPRAAGLHAVAGIMAHRHAAADGILDSRLTGPGETQLWRALMHVLWRQDGDADAMQLAATLPILRGYPAPLRDRLLPAALEAMASHGQAAAAEAALKTLPDDPALTLARAMVLEAGAHPAEALPLYDQVATRPDRLPRYNAMVRAVELRSRLGQLDAKGSADALERTLYVWREPGAELAERIRIAGLRQQAGQWKEAIEILREGRTAYPGDHVQLDRALAGVLTALLSADPKTTPDAAGFKALVEQYHNLIAGVDWPENVGLRLINRLDAGGMAAEAEPIAAHLVASSQDPGKRSYLGARLASLRLTMHDPAGAIAALASTAPPAGAGAPGVMAARQLTYALAEAARGNGDTALGMLQTVGTADADEARAGIYAKRKDWTHVVGALSAAEGKRITNPAALTATQQALVLRLAVASTLAADTATGQRLAQRYGAAMNGTGSAALFQLYTSAPVTKPADLPRAFEEIKVAQAAAAALGTDPPP